jgi:uncharacterized protein (TIGR00251 family)
MAELPPFVRVHPEGFTLAVRVTPKARTELIGPVRGAELTVKVTAAPEDGKANAAVVALLASALGIPGSRLEILRGQTSRSKVVLARSCTVEQVSRLMVN